MTSAIIIIVRFGRGFDFAQGEDALETLDDETLIVHKKRIWIEYSYGLEQKMEIQYGSNENGFTKRDLAEIVWKEYQRFQEEDILIDNFYYNINNLSLSNITFEKKNENLDWIILKPNIFHYGE